MNSLSKSNENSPEAIDVFILIQTSKNKNATAKNTAGKILGYRINLSTQVIAKDLSTGDEILNETFSYSLTYKTQDEFFETKCGFGNNPYLIIVLCFKSLFKIFSY